LLRLNGINVYYGELHVLWDICIEVRQKEKVAIIGSNASGKSTLLKTISGLLKPKTGEIEFLGKRIDKSRPDKIVELGLTLVPSERSIFPDMTVMENLEMGAYTKRARQKFYDTLEWIYTLFPILKERKNQLAGTLSGGERQMLAIARGLASQPRLLLLDEPSTGLSPKFVLAIFKVIEEINKADVTILLVEQNVAKTLELIDRAYVLENGKITMSGSGEELLANENFKKAFLGM